MKEEEYTQQYKGLIMLRKGRYEDADIWFATVGCQVVSDGTYKTKEELIESLENLKLETICNIILGVFGRMIELTNNNKEQ